MVYLVTVIRRNRQLIEDKLQEQIRKLQNFTSSLISTSKNKLISSGNLKEALEEILRSTAQVVDVSRISVWEFDETDFSIRLVVGYNSLDNSYFYDGYLRSESYPVYFQSLLSEKIINANDAVNDPKTKEFTESYLIPLGIKSMMDSPFFIDGKFKGILCFEEQRAIKQWDNMDQLFSISISKLISIAYYCQIRLEQYVSLLETRESLELKNELLESINSKMNIINGDLASDLHYKEEEAKQLQQFINEVSFKNAHHVRGPLSRILGLISLYKSEIDPESKKIYMDFLDQSAKELDDMVKEINAVLHRNFSK
jgi:transcriptional regulator with GAF, ATPase, and Fis domain